MAINFKELLALMVERKASDLFVTADLEVAMKVDGQVQPVTKSKLSAEESEQVVLGVMNDAQRAEFRATNECNFALNDRELGRFRVSAFRQQGMAGMVLRRIQSDVPTAEELHLPLLLNQLAMLKRGLILFVGATGTGKSTSLASMIKYRNAHSKGHIISIEDPIEFVHPHAGCVVTQREVGVDTESYEVALRNTLRQAPDVIMIGEIRSRATMEYAIAFAETGHLVFSTLHANNANQALDRIINFFPPEAQPQLFMDLSLNLRAIIAQQLLRRADGKGRWPVVEVMLSTPLVSDYIRKGEVHRLKEVIKNSREQGMQTFDQALYDAYRNGIISLEDALHHADSKNDLMLMIKLSQEGGIEKYSQHHDRMSVLGD